MNVYPFEPSLLLGADLLRRPPWPGRIRYGFLRRSSHRGLTSRRRGIFNLGYEEVRRAVGRRPIFNVSRARTITYRPAAENYVYAIDIFPYR